jgi:hypothetical protein
MNDLTLDELQMLHYALVNQRFTTDERTEMQLSLTAVLEERIAYLEELSAFADECEGGACKL